MPVRKVTVGYIAPRGCWRFACGHARKSSGGTSRKQWYLRGDKRQALAEATAIAARWEALRLAGVETWDDAAEPVTTAPAPAAAVLAAPAPLAVPVHRPRPQKRETVGESVDRYIEFKEAQPIDAKSKRRLAQRLRRATDGIRSEPMPPTVDLVNGAASAIGSRGEGDETISEAEARGRLNALRGWLLWLRNSGVVGEPVVAASRVKVVRERTVADLPLFTPEALNGLLAQADDRMRCLCLLALNGAMYGADLSDLRADELRTDNDGQTFIVRKRRKTGVESRHLLWPVTAEAVERQRDGRQGVQRLFTTARGRPLITKGQDNIGRQWAKLKNAEGWLPFSAFRDTAADWVYQRFGDDARKLILAHARRDVSDRYTRQRWNHLFEAQRAMGAEWVRQLF